MARRRGAGWLAQRRQRGSIAIMAAIWLSVAVIVLSGIDIGRFIRNDAICRRPQTWPRCRPS
jgi:hypothetical protein